MSFLSSRDCRIVVLLFTAAMFLGACSAAAPAASPPATAPSQAATSAPAAPPAAAQPTADSNPTENAKPTLQGSWDAVLAAARHEGSLTLFHPGGTGPEEVVSRFRQKYPWLRVETMGMRPTDFTPRVLAEQRNDLYAWDLQMGAVLAQANQVLRPAGALSDIRPMLNVLPAEVRNDSQWWSGFSLYQAPDRVDTFIFQIVKQGGLSVNRDAVSVADFSGTDQLLDPKFKGKILVFSPTRTSISSNGLVPILRSKGEDFVRKILIDQQPQVLDSTPRQATEWVVTGRTPILIGLIDTDSLNEFQAQGLGKNVQVIQEPENAFLLSSGIVGLKNPPHPNASAVFIGWLLSQEGQDAWATLSSPIANSRRKDVPNYHPDFAPDWAHLSEYKTWNGTPEFDSDLERVFALANKQ